MMAKAVTEMLVTEAAMVAIMVSVAEATVVLVMTIETVEAATAATREFNQQIAILLMQIDVENAVYPDGFSPDQLIVVY